MIEPEILMALAGALGTLVGAVAVWIKARARIDEMESTQESTRNQWEQDTIDTLRGQMAQFWADREATLQQEIAGLRVRINTLETEVEQLRTDGRAKDERIEELTARVHQLELENERLKAQRDARDEQIALLKEQGKALFTLVGDVSTLVRAYTTQSAPAPEQEQKAA